MNLREKFLKYCDDVYVDKEVNAGYCEEIADEFAIGFAEWINVNAYKFPNKTTTKELLEIYKKGL